MTERLGSSSVPNCCLRNILKMDEDRKTYDFMWFYLMLIFVVAYKQRFAESIYFSFYYKYCFYNLKKTLCKIAFNTCQSFPRERAFGRQT